MEGSGGPRRRIWVTAIVLISLLAAGPAWWAANEIRDRAAGSRRIDLAKDLAMSVLGRREPPPPRRQPPPPPPRPQTQPMDLVDVRTKAVTHLPPVPLPLPAPEHRVSAEQICNFVERGYCVFTDGTEYERLGALLELREVKRDCAPPEGALSQGPPPAYCRCDGVFQKGPCPVLIVVEPSGPRSINVTCDTATGRGGRSSVSEVRVYVEGTGP